MGGPWVGSRFPWVGSQNLDLRATLVRLISMFNYAGKSSLLLNKHSTVKSAAFIRLRIEHCTTVVSILRYPCMLLNILRLFLCIIISFISV